MGTRGGGGGRAHLERRREGGGAEGFAASPKEVGPGGPTWPSPPSSRSKERTSSEMRKHRLGTWLLLNLKIKQWN